MASRKSIERRECGVCQRVTPHVVTTARNGEGRILANPGECTTHREWTDGRIDVLGLDGVWVTIRPGRTGTG